MTPFYPFRNIPKCLLVPNNILCVCDTELGAKQREEWKLDSRKDFLP